MRCRLPALALALATAACATVPGPSTVGTPAESVARQSYAAVVIGAPPLMGGLGSAVARVQARGLDLLVEVEAQSLDEVREAVGAGVDRILLDNMSLEDLGAAIAIVDGAPTPAKPSPRRRRGAKRWPEIEASGGITLANVGTVARLGVDYISVGALTHSAPALDFSLEIERIG